MLLLRFNLFQILIFSSILYIEAVAQGQHFPIIYRLESRPATLLKESPHLRCFPVNPCKTFHINFFAEHLSTVTSDVIILMYSIGCRKGYNKQKQQQIGAL